MRSTWTLARLPPLFTRQNSLGQTLEIDLLCVFYRAKWIKKVAKNAAFAGQDFNGLEAPTNYPKPIPIRNG
jgi:hypothetical protein